MKITMQNRSKRTSRAGACHTLRIGIAVLLVSPFASWAQAQTPTGEDRKESSTHQAHAATKAHHDTRAAEAKREAKYADAKKDSSKAMDPMQGMDHSKMEGMDHSQMEGMDHSQMQGMDHSKMEGMDHGQMQGMDHSKMDGMDHSLMQGNDPSKMEGMDHSQMQGMDPSKMEGMDHSQMQGMDHSKMDGMDPSKKPAMDMGSMNMQGGSAPPDARDPDYSDGVDAGAMSGMGGMHGHSLLGSVIVDRLEQFHGDDANGQAIDAQAWYGSDLNKLWFKLDGERSDGRLGATRSELLWNRAFATYWGWQAGARHDFGEGPGRNWAAFGLQGLAPYWFDVQATAYIGEAGRTALRVEAEYELLLTQRLILQPDVEVNVYGKNDAARGIGSGFSDIDVGLRLRYEITRKFAPYVGVVWSRKFGKTADFARADFGQVEDTQLVAGVRLWF